MFSEIDGIKAAAIEDIKNLDISVKDLAQNMNEIKIMKQKQQVIYYEQEPSFSSHEVSPLHKTSSLKKVQFENNRASQQQKRLEDHQQQVREQQQTRQQEQIRVQQQEQIREQHQIRKQQKERQQQQVRKQQMERQHQSTHQQVNHQHFINQESPRQHSSHAHSSHKKTSHYYEDLHERSEEDAEFERADQEVFGTKVHRVANSPPSNSIVVINSQRNLDSMMNNKSERNVESHSSSRVKGSTYASPRGKSQRISPVRQLNPSGCECRDHYRKGAQTSEVKVTKVDDRGNSVTKTVATVAKNVRFYTVKCSATAQLLRFLRLNLYIF